MGIRLAKTLGLSKFFCFSMNDMLRSGIVYSRRSYDKVKEGGNGIFCPVKEVVIHVLQR